MQTYKCIKKARDKSGKITKYYLLENRTNRVMVASPKNLKFAIHAGDAEVTNLTLTQNDRLIDKKVGNKTKQLNEYNKAMDDAINKELQAKRPDLFNTNIKLLIKGLGNGRV